MQQLLQQFQRSVFCRRPLSCTGILPPFPQYRLWCNGSGALDLALTSDTVASIVSYPLSALTSCTRSPSCVSAKNAGRCWITGLSAAKISALPITPDLQEGLQRLGIRRLAEVQRTCLLRALGGTSLVVAAIPGAGKTLAYLLPVLQRFVAEDGRHMLDTSEGSSPSPFALILVPSRELARQVANVAMALLPHAPILLLDPASPVRQHQQQMSHLPVKIVISTPDRIRSLMRERRPLAGATGRAERAEPVYLSLKNLQILVVDEADCMLRRDYHSKVLSIYSTAMDCKAADKTGERLRACRTSLQLLCFSAVLPANLLAIYEAEFPHAEVLNLLNVTKYGIQGGVCGNGQAPGEKVKEATSNTSGSAGSAIVGAGVRHHICYIPSWSSSDASQDSACNGSAAVQKTGGRRRGQTGEEAHVEKERKMLALAETLRTFIPRLAHGNGYSIDAGSSGTEYELRLSEGREAQESASANNLEEQSVDGEDEERESVATSQPFTGEGRLPKAEHSSEEGPPQCIVFADSQEEVRYIKNHPLLDSWRIASVHSRMDEQDRQRAIHSFIEGDASVLVSTDIAARGFDIPSVVLIVHMHPPSTPENYTHRTGRAGRGRTPGTSVVLCSSVELRKLRDVERLGRVFFERRTLPAAADCQELMLRQLTADMLNVPSSQYSSVLNVAQRLHEKLGAQALATVLLKLGGATAHSALNVPTFVSRSVLSGRQGFVPLLMYDPTHAGSMAARRLLQELLPRGATPEAVGRIVKSVNGFVADVSAAYADHIVQKGKCREATSGGSLSRDGCTSASDNGFKEAWVPIFHLDQLPRLLSGGVGRRRHGRLPWTRMKLSLARSRKESRRQAARKDQVFKSDSLQLQELKNMNTGSGKHS